jgi:hypothetical protein
MATDKADRRGYPTAECLVGRGRNLAHAEDKGGNHSEEDLTRSLPPPVPSARAMKARHLWTSARRRELDDRPKK